MADHDHSYKNLFSHPQMVRDLLQGFVNEEWIDNLDFTSLKRVDGSYVTDDLQCREDDIVWRVKCSDSWIYIYILIEFQSTVDHYMAARLMTYIGLLYQSLIAAKTVTKKGKLPPVLPIVLYNGEPKWNAATSIEALIEKPPRGLERYRPSLHYLLLEENCYDIEGLPAQNLVAAIFRLEQSSKIEDVQAMVDALIAWLKDDDQNPIRRSFAVWIQRVLMPARLPEQTIPEVNDLILLCHH